jgi:hypothetical protein
MLYSFVDTEELIKRVAFFSSLLTHDVAKSEFVVWSQPSPFFFLISNFHLLRSRSPPTKISISILESFTKPYSLLGGFYENFEASWIPV